MHIFNVCIYKSPSQCMLGNSQLFQLNVCLIIGKPGFVMQHMKYQKVWSLCDKKKCLDKKCLVRKNVTVSYFYLCQELIRRVSDFSGRQIAFPILIPLTFSCFLFLRGWKKPASSFFSVYKQKTPSSLTEGFSAGNLEVVLLSNNK